MAILATREHPDFLAALERRGIPAERASDVQIDPWPAGTFGYAAEEGRRLARCICFLRDSETDNGYARPIEGLVVHFDLGRGALADTIHRVKLKTAAGTSDMQPKPFYEDAVKHLDRLLDNVRLMLVANVKSGEFSADFVRPDPAHGPIMARLQGAADASFLFKKFTADVNTTRKDFAWVTPYDERFKVQIGPLRAIGF